jgi:hypothetical protein
VVTIACASVTTCMLSQAVLAGTFPELAALRNPSDNEN